MELSVILLHCFYVINAFQAYLRSTNSFQKAFLTLLRILWTSRAHTSWYTNIFGKTKHEVDELNDNDDEIVFKQPISSVKEEVQETPILIHSEKKKTKKKKEQSVTTL
jgi:hypothetical protein